MTRQQIDQKNNKTITAVEAASKSSKRAWDEQQDLKLTKMIAEIGPHQWEQMAI